MTNDELVAGDNGFVERAKKRQEKIMIAVRNLSEDARELAKAEYGKLNTDEEKEAWAKENLGKKYKPGMSQEQIYQAYSSLKVNAYLNDLSQSVQEAAQKQIDFDKDERYDAISRAPKNDVKDIIDKADHLTDQVIDKGVGHSKFFGKKQKGTPDKRTLEEEAMSYMTAFPLEQMLANTQSTSSRALDDRSSLAMRKQRVEEIKAQRNEGWTKKTNAQFAPMRYGGRM